MFSSLSSDTARRERERGSTPRVLCHVGREFRFNYSDSDCCDLRGVGFVCDACHRCAVTSFAAGRTRVVATVTSPNLNRLYSYIHTPGTGTGAVV